MFNQVVHQRVNRWIGDEMATFDNQNLSLSEDQASSLITTEGTTGLREAPVTPFHASVGQVRRAVHPQ